MPTVPISVAVALIAATCLPAGAACQFQRPEALPAEGAAWLGACPTGVAQGPGVLRATPPNGPEFFFGAMRDGKPMRGVITQSDSQDIPAGSFDVGRALPAEDREQLIAVYKEAASGANAAGRNFAAKGDRAMAKYYQGWAKALRTALDRPE